MADKAKVIGSFSSPDAAEKAIRDMRSKGLTDNEMSVIAKGEKGQGNNDNSGGNSLSSGMTTGGVLGGITGLAASAGALMIPGIGPIVALGPLAATVTGAVGGGIVGSLVDWGIPAEQAQQYEQDIKSGGAIVSVESTRQKVDDAAKQLRAEGARNIYVK